MTPPLDHQEQAAQLARWLEEHPGSPAPEGLDPEVLETVYALRPDLAPAPSFSIDDILADISGGPFADAPADEPPTEELPSAGAEPGEEPSVLADGPSPAEPPALAPLVELAPARPRRAWLWPAAGALAAAAMALIVVTPYLKHGVPRLGQPEPAMTEAPGLDADLIAEVAAPRAEPSADRSALREAPTAEELPPPEVLPAAPAQPESSVGGGGVRFQDSLTRTGSGVGSATVTTSTEQAPGGPAAQHDLAPTGGEALDAPSRAPAPPPASTPAQAKPLGGWAGAIADGDLAEVSGPIPAAAPPEEAAPSGADASRDAAPSDGGYFGLEAEDDEYDDFAFDEVAKSESSVSARASGRTSRDERKRSEEDLDDRNAALEDYDQEASGSILAAERRRADRSPKAAARPRARQAGESSEAPAAAPPSAEPDEPAPVVAEAAVAADDGLDALRSQASPLDYRADWYLRDPSLDEATRALVRAAFAKSQSAVVAGDVAGAMAALSALLSSPHPRVVQDAAYRLATLQLQAGQLDQAGTTVQRGLSASGSPTVFRSRLLSLHGAILEERGRPAEAVESYREAVEDNDARH